VGSRQECWAHWPRCQRRTRAPDDLRPPPHSSDSDGTPARQAQIPARDLRADARSIHAFRSSAHGRSDLWRPAAQTELPALGRNARIGRGNRYLRVSGDGPARATFPVSPRSRVRAPRTGRQAYEPAAPARKVNKTLVGSKIVDERCIIAEPRI